MWIKYKKDQIYQISVHTRVPSEAPGLDPGINKRDIYDVDSINVFKSGKHKGYIKEATTTCGVKYRINRNGICVTWQSCTYSDKGGEWVGDKRWDCTTYSLNSVTT